jgi:hypothetical protein
MPTRAAGGKRPSPQAARLVGWAGLPGCPAARGRSPRLPPPRFARQRRPARTAQPPRRRSLPARNARSVAAAAGRAAGPAAAIRRGRPERQPPLTRGAALDTPALRAPVGLGKLRMPLVSAADAHLGPVHQGGGSRGERGQGGAGRHGPAGTGRRQQAVQQQARRCGRAPVLGSRDMNSLAVCCVMRSHMPSCLFFFLVFFFHSLNSAVLVIRLTAGWTRRGRGSAGGSGGPLWAAGCGRLRLCGRAPGPAHFWSLKSCCRRRQGGAQRVGAATACGPRSV